MSDALKAQAAHLRHSIETADGAIKGRKAELERMVADRDWLAKELEEIDEFLLAKEGS